MNKRKWMTLTAMILLLTLLVCLYQILLSPFNPFTPIKPNCLPIKYPDGTLVNAENGKKTSYEGTEPFSDLVSFYKKELKNPKNKNREWRWVLISEEEILFTCTSAVNAYEAERGCIYLKKLENSVVITSVWSHFLDSAPLCSYYIEELQSR